MSYLVNITHGRRKSGQIRKKAPAAVQPQWMQPKVPASVSIQKKPQAKQQLPQQAAQPVQDRLPIDDKQELRKMMAMLAAQRQGKSVSAPVQTTSAPAQPSHPAQPAPPKSQSVAQPAQPMAAQSKPPPSPQSRSKVRKDSDFDRLTNTATKRRPPTIWARSNRF